MPQFKATVPGGTGLQFALQLRAMRRQEERDRAADALAQQKFEVQSRKERLAAAKSIADLNKTRLEIEDLMRGREAEIGPLLQLSSDANAPDTQRQTAANQAIRRIEGATRERAQFDVAGGAAPTRETINAAAEAVGGTAGTAVPLARQETASEVSKAIQIDRGKIGNLVFREIAKTEADVESGRTLIKKERDIKKQIKAIEQSGGDAGAEKDLLGFVQETRKSRTRKGQINVTNPPNFGQLKEVQQSVSSKIAVINEIGRIAQAMESGELQVGVRGSIANAVEVFGGLLEDLSGSELVGSQSGQLASLIDQARSGQDQVQFVDSNGDQQTLGLDAMVLAWQFVKANKNSARITLLEFTTALKELQLTGPLRTEARVRSALRKVLKSTSASAAGDASLLNRFGIQLSPNLGQIRPQDQSTLDLLGPRSSQAPTPVPTPLTSQGDPASFDTLGDAPTADQIREAARGEARRVIESRGTP